MQVSAKLSGVRKCKMPEDAIHIENVSKTVKRDGRLVETLHNITMHVGKGEMLSILGEYQSGKSTLINTIGGLIRPTKGDIYYGSENICLLDEQALSTFRRKRICIINKHSNLSSDLYVKESMMLPLIIDKQAVSKEYIGEIAAAFGVNEFLDDLPCNLSIDQRQRCALACAVAHKPDVIFCDEPTGLLDHDAAAEMLSLLHLANRQFGQTIVIATSDADIAVGADRTLQMMSGRILNHAHGNASTTGT